MFCKNGVSVAIRCMRSASFSGGRRFLASDSDFSKDDGKKEFSIERTNIAPLPQKYEDTLVPKVPKKLATVEGALDDCWQVSGVPDEHIFTRRARIFIASRASPQQGFANTKQWKVDLDNRERWENPLMGWSSSGDPLSNISQQLEFGSKEDAIRFCLRQGWEYEVVEPQEQKIKPKAYGSNYSWDKPTRVSTK